MGNEFDNYSFFSKLGLNELPSLQSLLKRHIDRCFPQSNCFLINWKTILLSFESLPLIALKFKDSGVFSLGVSQNMNKLTNLWKFELNWWLKLQDNYEKEIHLFHTKLYAFRCLIARHQILYISGLIIKFVENHFFSRKLIILSLTTDSQITKKRTV